MLHVLVYIVWVICFYLLTPFLTLYFALFDLIFCFSEVVISLLEFLPGTIHESIPRSTNKHQAIYYHQGSTKSSIKSFDDASSVWNICEQWFSILYLLLFYFSILIWWPNNLPCHIKSLHCPISLLSTKEGGILYTNSICFYNEMKHHLVISLGTAWAQRESLEMEKLFDIW